MKTSKLFLTVFFMLLATAVFAQPMANDNFDRTAGPGTWGNSTDGQAWSFQAPPAGSEAKFSVDASVGGFIENYGGGNFTLTLGNKTASDVEAVIRASTQFKKEDGVSNTDANFGVVICANEGVTQLYKAHIQPDGLHLQKRFGGSGADVPGCPVVLKPAPQNDRVYFIRLRKVGNVISAKCWLEDSTEAKGFGITYTEDGTLKGTGALPAGMVGVRGTMNSAVSMTYYKFTAVDLNPLGGDAVDNPTVERMPSQYALGQNYPNPFNPTTQITISLPARTHVQLDVYDVLGKKVATLVNETMNAGPHTIPFDASGLASGTYICKLNAGSQTLTKRMTLVR